MFFNRFSNITTVFVKIDISCNQTLSSSPMIMATIWVPCHSKNLSFEHDALSSSKSSTIFHAFYEWAPNQYHTISRSSRFLAVPSKSIYYPPHTHTHTHTHTRTHAPPHARAHACMLLPNFGDRRYGMRSELIDLVQTHHIWIFIFIS